MSLRFSAVPPIRTAQGTKSWTSCSKILGAAELDDDSEYSLKSRNAGMADTAAGYLESGKKVFFVVGAGHMVGPDGIPALLKKMGYTVERA